MHNRCFALGKFEAPNGTSRMVLLAIRPATIPTTPQPIMESILHAAIPYSRATLRPCISLV